MYNAGIEKGRGQCECRMQNGAVSNQLISVGWGGVGGGFDGGDSKSVYA